MCGIPCQEHTANAHTLDTAVVRTEVVRLFNLVLSGLWMTRKQLLEGRFTALLYHRILALDVARDDLLACH